MNADFISKQIGIDKNKRLTVKKAGFYPIYFDDTTMDDVSKHFGEIINICSKMWTIFGYTGLMTPWHESNPMKQLNFQKKNLQKWFANLNKMDVSVEAYCIICCSISSHDKYQRPAMLLGQTAHLSWIKKLRNHAGSRERINEVAKFILKFVELQVDRIDKAYINPSNVVKADLARKGKFLETYHRIADRINQLSSLGIDYKYWMERKFDKSLESMSDKRIYINTIVNINGLEPDLDEISKETTDPWSEIRRFLGLPKDCVFPDEYIPKGWNISSDDVVELKDVIKVMGDGFYFYRNGSQRRGKRHYASNRYFIIKCDFSNFPEFKNKWFEITLISAKPTWNEYKNWAMFPGVWNEAGESLIHTKDVKWRKK